MGKRQKYIVRPLLWALQRWQKRAVEAYSEGGKVIGTQIQYVILIITDKQLIQILPAYLCLFKESDL